MLVLSAVKMAEGYEDSSCVILVCEASLVVEADRADSEFGKMNLEHRCD